MLSTVVDSNPAVPSLTSSVSWVSVVEYSAESGAVDLLGYVVVMAVVLGADDDIDGGVLVGDSVDTRDVLVSFIVMF